MYQLPGINWIVFFSYIVFILKAPDNILARKMKQFYRYRFIEKCTNTTHFPMNLFKRSNFLVQWNLEPEKRVNIQTYLLPYHFIHYRHHHH